ncbi:uncharacterized protein LOC111269867 [Varroa jacobsoni]|uniref:uncharacterized protein LOC111269867 n=1 Tax=Varroa jacobsoni TaxID=62625 RepID=UPI000BF27E7A|nr:uncharacterized protein LOC111269867 [Varroa jacobsoni]
MERRIAWTTSSQGVIAPTPFCRSVLLLLVLPPLLSEPPWHLTWPSDALTFLPACTQPATTTKAAIRYASLRASTYRPVFVGASHSGEDDFSFAPPPQSVSVQAGHGTLLQCGVTDNTSIEIHWTRGGEPVVESVRRRMEGTNLRFVRVEPEFDTGEFQCIATNTSSGFTISSDPVSINILSQHNELDSRCSSRCSHGDSLPTVGSIVQQPYLIPFSYRPVGYYCWL